MLLYAYMLRCRATPPGLLLPPIFFLSLRLRFSFRHYYFDAIIDAAAMPRGFSLSLLRYYAMPPLISASYATTPARCCCLMLLMMLLRCCHAAAAMPCHAAMMLLIRRCCCRLLLLLPLAAFFADVAITPDIAIAISLMPCCHADITLFAAMLCYCLPRLMLRYRHYYAARR